MVKSFLIGRSLIVKSVNIMIEYNAPTEKFIRTLTFSNIFPVCRRNNVLNIRCEHKIQILKHKSPIIVAVLTIIYI